MYTVMTNDNFEDSLPSPESTPEPAPEATSVPIAAPTPEEPIADEPSESLESSESQESFADMLSAFELSHSHKAESGKGPGQRQLQGVVISLSADQVFLDIGYKTEGVLPRSAFDNNAEAVKAGDTFPVSVTGRNTEHYYELSRFKVAQPRDWSALEAAFAEKIAIVGTVTEVRKGGVTVDVGVRAFMPASRSGTKDAAELEKLVGTEITCRITKLDVTDEDVVVDRRIVLEEQARGLTAARRDALTEGSAVTGTVRTLMPYGAFVDLGGIDGLLHVSDIAHARVTKPEDVLTVGQELQLKILKIDPETKKISLGLKQTLADPWTEVERNFPAGSEIEGPITKLMNFGAFVQLADGVEGLVHISEITAERRLNHPSDVLRAGQIVKAQVLAIDPAKRQIKLSMKQLIPTEIDEYIAEHKVGDTVSGRVIEQSPSLIHVELGDGIRATCRTASASTHKAAKSPEVAATPAAKPDLSNLSALFKDRHKANAAAAATKPEPTSEGQIRNFKITRLDAEAKKIEVELA
jgi:small subunit ribosomal protein S1